MDLRLCCPLPTGGGGWKKERRKNKKRLKTHSNNSLRLLQKEFGICADPTREIACLYMGRRGESGETAANF